MHFLAIIAIFNSLGGWKRVQNLFYVAINISIRILWKTKTKECFFIKCVHSQKLCLQRFFKLLSRVLFNLAWLKILQSCCYIKTHYFLWTRLWHRYKDKINILWLPQIMALICKKFFETRQCQNLKFILCHVYTKYFKVLS